MKHTKQLLAFVMEQELELKDYHSLVPLIKKKFSVAQKAFLPEHKPGHEQLVDVIIAWEKSSTSDSLEKTLNEKFYIEEIEPAKVIPGKVIDIPDKDIARIRKETTHVAGVINREMVQLQKKFPDHFFQLQFEFQRLGKQKFYKIKLNTFKDE